MPGMRRKVTFIKLKFFRIERRREEELIQDYHQYGVGSRPAL
jgi:hypothetical protein